MKTAINVTHARRHRRLALALKRVGLSLLAVGMAAMIAGAALALASLLAPWGLVGALAGMSLYAAAGDYARGC